MRLQSPLLLRLEVTEILTAHCTALGLRDSSRQTVKASCSWHAVRGPEPEEKIGSVKCSILRQLEEVYTEEAYMFALEGIRAGNSQGCHKHYLNFSE